MENATQSWSEIGDLKENASDRLKQGRRAAEKYTEKAASRTPTILFIAAALASIGVSATFQFLGKRNWSLFVGQWAPSFLLFGIHNKLIKEMGSK